MSVNQTENQEIIKALFEGKTVELRHQSEENWQIYSAENEKFLFGPWNCADSYLWRVKPVTVTKEIEFTKIVRLKEVFVFEGVKQELYKEGETIHYISIRPAGNADLKLDYKVGHDQSVQDKNHIYFETAEYAQKAYNQIINKTKDSK